MILILLTHLVFAQPTPSSSCSLDGISTPVSNGWYKIQGDLVNLRKTPSTKGTVLTEVPLASTAKISSCVKQETLGKKTGCWYQVTDITTKGVTTQYKSAYLYFTAIAPCFIRGDFDEDGVLEEAFLAQTDEEQFQVRLSDPNAKTPMIWVTENGFATSTTLTAIPKRQTGHTMLTLSLMPEACGYTGYVHYYIYSNKPTPTLYKTISTENFSDSPAYYNTSIDWNTNDTVIYKSDYTTGSSSQKHCLKNFKYEPCGPKKEQQKEQMDTGM